MTGSLLQSIAQGLHESFLVLLWINGLDSGRRGGRLGQEDIPLTAWGILSRPDPCAVSPNQTSAVLFGSLPRFWTWKMLRTNILSEETCQFVIMFKKATPLSPGNGRGHALFACVNCWFDSKPQHQSMVLNTARVTLCGPWGPQGVAPATANWNKTGTPVQCTVTMLS